MASEPRTDKSLKQTESRLYSEVVEAVAVAGANPGEIIQNASQFSSHMWMVKITGLSTNVVLSPQGTLSEADGWATITADGNNLTYTGDGVYWIDASRGIRPKAVRLEIVSGAATSIQVWYRGAN